MQLSAFKASLKTDAPPAEADLALQALWHAAKGDWDQAHRLAQAQDDKAGAWVHAYLHRVEGDADNATYWYRRAGKPMVAESLEEEWDRIAASLLAGGDDAGGKK